MPPQVQDDIDAFMQKRTATAPKLPSVPKPAAPSVDDDVDGFMAGRGSSPSTPKPLSPKKEALRQSVTGLQRDLSATSQQVPAGKTMDVDSGEVFDDSKPFSSPKLIYKPAGVAPRPRPTTPRTEQAARVARQIEDTKREATRLFQQADQTPGFAVGGGLNPGQQLRAQAEGKVEAANALARKAQQQYGDVLEVGFGKDKDPNSKRQWAYAKAKTPQAQEARDAVDLRAGNAERFANPRGALNQSLNVSPEAKARFDRQRRVEQMRASGGLDPTQRIGTRIAGMLGGTPESEIKEALPALSPVEEASNNFAGAAIRGVVNAPESVARFYDRNQNRADLLTISASKRLLQNPNLSPEDRSRLQSQIQQATSRLSNVGDSVEPLSTAGEKFARTALPVDESRPQSINPLNPNFYIRTLPEAAGSMAPFMAAGALGNAAGVAPRLVSGISGAGMNIAPQYREARAAGATPEQLARAVDVGSATGAMEALGAESLMGKLPGKGRAAHWLKEGLGESLQEGSTQVAQDVSDKYYTGTKPNLTLSQMAENAAQNAVPAFFLGGAGGVGAHIAENSQNRAAAQAVQNERAPMPSIAPTMTGPTQVTQIPGARPARPTVASPQAQSVGNDDFQKHFALRYQNGQFTLDEAIPLEQAPPQNVKALVDVLQGFQTKPDVPPQMAAAAGQMLQQVQARLAGSTIPQPEPLTEPLGGMQFPEGDTGDLLRMYAGLLGQEEAAPQARSLPGQPVPNAPAPAAEPPAVSTGQRLIENTRARAVQLAEAGDYDQSITEWKAHQQALRDEQRQQMKATKEPGRRVQIRREFNRAIGEAGARIGDLRQQKRAAAKQANVPTAELPEAKKLRGVENQPAQVSLSQPTETAPLLRPDAVQNPEGGIPQMPEQTFTGRLEQGIRRDQAAQDSIKGSTEDLTIAGMLKRRFPDGIRIADKGEARNLGGREGNALVGLVNKNSRTGVDDAAYALHEEGLTLPDGRPFVEDGRVVATEADVLNFLRTNGKQKVGGTKSLAKNLEQQEAEYYAQQEESTPARAEQSFKWDDKERTYKTRNEYGDEWVEKNYQKGEGKWKVSDDLGGSAFGDIRDGVASIVGMESIPIGKRYTSEEGNFKRRGFFRQLIQTLQANGAKSIEITLQSADTQAAVRRLLKTGELVNPREVRGSSGNEHPTLFDIPQKQQPSKNFDEIAADVDSDTETGALRRSIARSNERGHVMQEPGVGLVSMSPYADMVARNQDAVDRLYQSGLASPEGKEIFRNLREFAAKNGIEARHLHALADDVRNHELEKARWADRGIDFSTVQSLDEGTARLRDSVLEEGKSLPDVERTALEREVAALDALFEDTDATNLLARAAEGDNNAANEFKKRADEYGIGADTVGDLIQARTSDRSANRAPRQVESRTPQSVGRDTRTASQREARSATPEEFDLLGRNPATIPNDELDAHLRALEQLRNDNIRGIVKLAKDDLRELRRALKNTNDERQLRVKQKQLGPKNEPRYVPTMDERRARWAEKATKTEGKPAARVSADANLSNLSQDDLIAQIKKIPPSDRESSPYFQEYQKRGLNKMGATASKEEAKSLSDLGGYEKKLSAPVAAKAVAQMNTVQRINGTLQTRKQFVEDSVKNGATVERREGQRAIVQPSGSYMLERSITKTAIDYAEYLIDSQKKPEPKTAKPADSLAQIENDLSWGAITEAEARRRKATLKEQPKAREQKEAPRAAQTLADTNIQFKSGKGGRGGTLYANESALDVMRAAFEEVFGNRVEFNNVNLNAPASRRMAKVLTEAANDPDFDAATKRKLRTIAREFTHASQAGETVSIVDISQGRKFSDIKTSRRHELFHDAQEGLQNSDGFLAKHKYGKQLIEGLAHYPIEDRTIESAAFIAGGQAKEFGLTEAQGNEFLEDYFNDIVKQNGADALRRFVSVAPHAMETLRKAKERYGIQGQAREDNSGTDAERGNGRLGTDGRAATEGKGVSGTAREQKRLTFGELDREPQGQIAASGLGGLQNLFGKSKPKTPANYPIPKDFDLAKWSEKTLNDALVAALPAKAKEDYAKATTKADKLKILAQSQMTADSAKKIKEQLVKVQTAAQKGDGRAILEAVRDLKEYTQAPATNWEKASTLRKAFMLSRPVTHLRNVLGNTSFQPLEELSRIPGSLADSTVGLLTGRRTLLGPNVADMARATHEAATTGVRRAKDMMQGLDTDKLEDALQTKEVKFKTKIVDKAVKAIFRSLGAEDQIFFTYAYDRALREQAKLTARNEAKAGVIARKAVSERSKALYESPTEQMDVDAMTAAEVAVFRNKNKLSSALGMARQSLGDKGTFAVDLFLPFDKTPTNIIARTLEYTPIGGAIAAGKGLAATGRAVRGFRAEKQAGTPTKAAIKAAIDAAMTPAQQRSFAQLVGRSVTGTAPIALGYVLAAAGMATGFYDEEDRKGNAKMKELGARPSSIKIGDRWYQIGGMPPLGNLIALGATLHKQIGDEADPDAEDATLGMAKGVMQVATDVPLLKSAKDLLEAIEKPDRSGQMAGRMASSFIPGILGDVGQVTPGLRDPYERETRAPKGVKGFSKFKQEAVNEVTSKIPGLRKTLPEKKTALGKPLETEWSDVIDPFSSRPATQLGTDFNSERLRQGTVPTELRPKKGEPDAVFQQRKQRVEGWMSEYGDKLVASPRYQALSEAEQKAAMKLLRDRIGRQQNLKAPKTASLEPNAVLLGVRKSAAMKPKRDRRNLWNAPNP